MANQDGSATPPSPNPPAAVPPSAATPPAAVKAAQDAISAAQSAQAESTSAAVAVADPPTRTGNDGATRFEPPVIAQPDHDKAPEGIKLLDDVALNVKIELGRTKMLLEDVLRLGEGSVVELDKLAGDPVDVYVNDRPVARGEVLVLNDNFCVRINEILSPPGAEAA
ncbi:MAG: flagellar motor switch protein FliN [Phycisphaerales bacterium]